MRLVQFAQRISGQRRIRDKQPVPGLRKSHVIHKLVNSLPGDLARGRGFRLDYEPLSSKVQGSVCT